MANFVSKIQYKICEKGEFFDEQVRSLADTLSIIKAFPWDIQRGADVQLSGPGIVIENEKGDYLKVALYFNGKFSMYYLDADNHLSEYHTPDLTDECRKVEEFFKGELNLEGFDKHFFNIGNKAHFVSQTFEYRVSFWSIAPAPFFLGIYAAALLFAISRSVAGLGVVLVAVVVIILTLAVVITYNNHKNTYLKLSKGHDEFFFGKEPGDVKAYNKQDIKEVVIYEKRSARAPTVRRLEIHLKNGESLTIPTYVITALTFMSKFRDDMVRFEYT